MTFYHFGNCLALAYAPYHMTYKYTGLSDYGAFWKCVTAGFLYVFTQLAKMIFLATFFPSDEEPENADDEVPYVFFTEFLKLTVDLVDLFGLYLVIQRVSGKGQIKILTAGLGWSFADFLLTRVLFLWVGARGVEFDWRYLQKSFESNLSLVHFLTLSCLVWLAMRKDLGRSSVVAPLIAAVGLVACYKNLLLDALVPVFGFAAVPALAVKAAITLLVGFVTMQVYAVVTVNDKY